VTDRRVLTLTAALSFLQLSPRAPELQLLHRWLDTWAGIGLIAAACTAGGGISSSRSTATGTGARPST